MWLFLFLCFCEIKTDGCCYLMNFVLKLHVWEFLLDNCKIWINTLAHWNNSPQIEMSSNSDTLSWFLAYIANQSLLFLLINVGA
jgi:hypothetical protein